MKERRQSDVIKKWFLSIGEYIMKFYKPIGYKVEERRHMKCNNCEDKVICNKCKAVMCINTVIHEPSGKRIGLMCEILTYMIEQKTGEKYCSKCMRAIWDLQIQK